MRFRLFFLFLLLASVADSQSTLEVFDRKTYLETRLELSDIPLLVKKYSSSKLPLHVQLDISDEDNLKESHFTELAKLPITAFRFTVWKKEKFYCKGLDLLQTLDSLELGGHTHSFLNDASKLVQLQHLRLEIFQQDSTITQKASFPQLKIIWINLSSIYDLSEMFDSIPKLEYLYIGKHVSKFELTSSLKFLKEFPLEKLCLGMVQLDTTNLKSAICPGLKKVWLVGVSRGTKNFDFETFIRQNPSLEYVNLRMNSLDKEFVADLRKKFPNVTIDDK